MSLPLKPYWDHNEEDKSTWKYLHATRKKYRNKWHYEWVLNPSFKYKDKDPSYSESVNVM